MPLVATKLTDPSAPESVPRQRHRPAPHLTQPLRSPQGLPPISSSRQVRKRRSEWSYVGARQHVDTRP